MKPVNCWITCKINNSYLGVGSGEECTLYQTGFCKSRIICTRTIRKIPQGTSGKPASSQPRAVRCTPTARRVTAHPACPGLTSQCLGFSLGLGLGHRSHAPSGPSFRACLAGLSGVHDADCTELRVTGQSLPLRCKEVLGGQTMCIDQSYTLCSQLRPTHKAEATTETPEVGEAGNVVCQPKLQAASGASSRPQGRAAQALWGSHLTGLGHWTRSSRI